ncbi:FtsX-like permease family protein [Phenylobacterium sp.]|uniref:ABC transporter permease n=1 Tax=Phenylobacterium sp. TaxID=1871053 RepID=UPI001224BA08|nr:FtsX-like permease family protein [Phenylobacterium sp.]THD61348.1 MAG: FtsX-like permease family protein [Phenylobacterium sp.]
MWLNYARSLYRTLSRHRLYAALNVLGLALGIAVCAVLLLVVRFETGFDRWAPHRDAIYRVNEISTWPGQPRKVSDNTQAMLLGRLQADFAQIRAGARLMDNTLTVRNGAQQALEHVMFADPSIWDVFPVPFVAGDRSTALSDTTSVVVSQAMARKYFGTERALGRRLTIVIDGQPRDYRVSGVMRDLPADSNLVLEVVVRLGPEVTASIQDYMKSWSSSMMETYVRLGSPADAAGIDAGFPAFVDRETDIMKPAHAHLNYQLIPLAQVHFVDANQTTAMKPGVDGLFVAALGVMGVVALLIAVVNYVSLATARAGMRAREVAIRKVMGATRRMLVAQFIGESLAVALAAGLIGTALLELALPGVSAVLGEPIRIAYFGPDGLLAPLLGLCLAVGLAAGIYPAFVLSRFRSAAVLASARTPGGGRTGARLREVMAVGQFAIAICLMICTAVIFGQMQFLRNSDLGFRRDGLVIVRNLGDMQVAPQMRALLDAFRRTPGVILATASDRRPDPDTNESGDVRLLSNPLVRPNLLRERIGTDYDKTYGLKLLAGRMLDANHGGDDRAGVDYDKVADSGAGINMMVNASGARELGFADPQKALGARVEISKTDKGNLLVATVVGVVADVRFVSPRLPPPPQLYLMDSHLGPVTRPSSWTAAIRVRDGDQAEVLGRLERVWRQLAPGSPFQGETVQVTMKPFYDSDARRGQLFAAGAVLSAAIACLGLYGLAAFNTSRRLKEIGIRKTLGASTSDVLRLLVGEFLRPVLWANLIAWPAAFLAMRWWLAGFDQRIALNPAYFLLPSLAALLVAVLTVAEQAIRVSRAEPSRALRYE